MIQEPIDPTCKNSAKTKSGVLVHFFTNIVYIHCQVDFLPHVRVDVA